MNKVTNVFLGLFLMVISVAFIACGDDDPDDVTDDGPDLADVAQEDTSFLLLAEALQCADLLNTLGGAQDYTVFAPTNEAIDNFVADNSITNICDVPQADLANVVLYHTVQGTLSATDLASMDYVTTMLDGPGNSKVSLYVKDDNGIVLEGSVRVSTSVTASNGVYHKINSVLEAANVSNMVFQNDDHYKFFEAAFYGNVDLETDNNTFTVFVPSNAAIDALLASLNETNVRDVDTTTLNNLVRKHVVSGANVRSNQLSAGPVTTLNGDINITLNNGVTINDSISVTMADIQATNGVIHFIDKIID